MIIKPFVPLTPPLIFADIYSMYYELFGCIGLSLNRDQYLFDQDTGVVLKYKDKYIKATTVPAEIYAGRTDVLFEPDKNYNLVVVLLGYYIDKEVSMGNDIGFIAQYVEDDISREKQRVVVKTRMYGDVVSKFYYNIYLGYIECIFKLSGYDIIELDKFDIPREQ